MSTQVPEVSLITSWCIAPASADGTPALVSALKHSVNLLDLYFLSHLDIPWFRRLADIPNTPATPLQFAARLTFDQIDRIADALTSELTEHYEGVRVGPRPRFAALATYWPLLSLPEEEQPAGTNLRAQSVEAVQNSLYLALRLGCRCVEIVGGSALPEAEEIRESLIDAKSYRATRMKALARSLVEVFDPNATRIRKMQERLTKLRGGEDSSPRSGPSPIPAEEQVLPCLAVEIEPGESFLINNLEAYQMLKAELRQYESVAGRQTLLNLDIAHLILLEDEHSKPIEYIRTHRLQQDIAHMHLSDHARSHAADLTPGTYHFLPDYRPWIELALELCNQESSFSGVIAIELEGCNDIHEAARAIGKVRRWIRGVSDRWKPLRPTLDAIRLSEGAIVAVDIGNSTEALSLSRPGEAGWCHTIEETVSKICKDIHDCGGSVLSFTGDGVIAFFAQIHFQSPQRAAEEALRAAHTIRRLLEGPEPITLRSALNWGGIYIPAGGRLRHQAIGPEVIRVTRLCDWIAKIIEPSIMPNSRDLLVAATNRFVKRLPVGKQKDFTPWGEVTFKGLKRPSLVHLARTNGAGKRPTRRKH